jgi:NIMA (never in mitosis gene a)-related kinase 1/4/5
MENFKIGRRLGKGSFGEVLKVYRNSDRKTYALKKIQLRGVSRKEQQYALNEVRLLASLQHKNIIKFHEAFPHGRSCYSMSLCIVMEYAQGGDMDRLIKRHRSKGTSIPEESIWSYASQIANGLCYLHQNKILHRDIKAANCFLTHDGVVKIGDMNISRTVEKGQLVRTKMGTPYYMSPEIWKNQSYDSKSDIWSFGCLLYELASLTYPFTGASMYSLSRNVCSGKYKHIPNNLYSRSVWRLIYSMLRVKPERRSTIETICVKTDSHLKLSSHQPGWAVEKRLPIKLLRTIRMMPTVEQLTDRLPNPCYDQVPRYDPKLPNICESRNPKKPQLMGRANVHAGIIPKKPKYQPSQYDNLRSPRIERLRKKYAKPRGDQVSSLLGGIDKHNPVNKYKNKPPVYQVDVKVEVDPVKKVSHDKQDNPGQSADKNVQISVQRLHKLKSKANREKYDNQQHARANNFPRYQEIRPIKIPTKIPTNANGDISNSPPKLKLPVI